jgi:hypothetical protein
MQIFIINNKQHCEISYILIFCTSLLITMPIISGMLLLENLKYFLHL